MTEQSNSTGLAENTTYIKIYLPKQVKEQLEEDSGSASLSQHCLNQIIENKARKQQKEPESRNELKKQIRQLEQQLKNQDSSRGKETSSSDKLIEDNQLLQLLEENEPIQISELIQEILENPDISLAEKIETQLYQLANQNQVKYSRTNQTGWKTI